VSGLPLRQQTVRDDDSAYPGGVTFRPFTAVAAEGARIALFTCDACGATVMLDPREEDGNPLETHAEWHAAFTTQRLFKRCAYCGLTRLCEWRGRGRWICDGCWDETTDGCWDETTGGGDATDAPAEK
jgi:ribosomal protein L37AE/L43A